MYVIIKDTKRQKAQCTKEGVPFFWQRSPLYPSGQLHTNRFDPVIEHEPPFWQGLVLPEHASTRKHQSVSYYDASEVVSQSQTSCREEFS